MNPVSISALESAINLARQVAPATGSEAALTADVDVLAALYGELIFRGHRMFDADSLEPVQQEVLAKWSSPAASENIPHKGARAA